MDNPRLNWGSFLQAPNKVKHALSDSLRWRFAAATSENPLNYRLEFSFGLGGSPPAQGAGYGLGEPPGKKPPKAYSNDLLWLIGCLAAALVALICVAVGVAGVALYSMTTSRTAARPDSETVRLKIVSSLPMTGASLVQTQTIVNAMQLRLEQADSQACDGMVKLTYEPWDDASASLGKWDPEVETENARKAADDSSVIVYLGTFNSGAARLSIPILNQAGPLVMISPANTYPGLTRPGRGEAGEPDKYYPSDLRNYTRLTSPDDIQGEVAARFIRNELNANTVFVIDDGEQYGTMLADAFEDTAAGLGLRVVGREHFDPRDSDYIDLMAQIAESDNGSPPDAIYASMIVDNNAAQLLKDKVKIMGDQTQVKVVGPDGIQTSAFTEAAGADIAEGVYASVGGLTFDKLPAAAQQFRQDYDQRYGGSLNETYAVYGYEAMSVALKEIEDVCASGGDPADRRAVRDAVFAIRDFDGVLGTWSFDKNGDTTLTDMTFYVIRDGEYVYYGHFK